MLILTLGGRVFFVIFFRKNRCYIFAFFNPPHNVNFEGIRSYTFSPFFTLSLTRRNPPLRRPHFDIFLRFETGYASVKICENIEKSGFFFFFKFFFRIHEMDYFGDDFREKIGEKTVLFQKRHILKTFI